MNWLHFALMTGMLEGGPSTPGNGAGVILLLFGLPVLYVSALMIEIGIYEIKRRHTPPKPPTLLQKINSMTREERIKFQEERLGNMKH